MTSGYWHSNYWPINYWMADYWPEYAVWVGVQVPLPDFRYQSLKLELPPGGIEGTFSYEHSSLKAPDQGPEGSFAYQRLHLKKVTEE